MRNLKSLPGVLLSLLVLLIILSFVLKVAANQGQGIPVVGGAVSGAARFAQNNVQL